MGIPGLRSDKENVPLPRFSRPWDNVSPPPIPPPQSPPLADFFANPAPSNVPTHLSTRLGNRELKPPYAPLIPPPLAALPLPPKPPPSHPRDDAIESIPKVGLCIQDDTPPPRLSRSRATTTEPSSSTSDHPDMPPRFSYRRSVRFPSVNTVPDRPDSSARSFRLVAAENLNFLPSSSSFLDFNDDERLQKLSQNVAPQQNPLWHGLSFDDADSFSTFGTLDNHVPDAPIPPTQDQMPRPNSDESQAAPLPTASSPDDDDGALDVPKRIVSRPAATGALKDLQRASITAGRELASSLRMMAEAEKKGNVAASVPRAGSVSKAQGELLLRSRIFRRWNLRYASIVHQGYFGAVLLLFRPESRGVLGSIALRNSKMIALTETAVRRLESKKPNSPFMFELRTSQRTYTFGCKEAEGREFWVNHLSLPDGGG
ncbi:hypothetical protein BWQ96_01823 [Gracilariopsis chorda]|uniref:PH domain-containing protein n=1 Tax=Gracilariopsis chorda TaxID=448386 RepID=A0A2V3J201_9FLOR|nr:hypothetical protein BWQ96_01823 [Gracilariopsis chorda]|eukprot:PXF48363.1 hypothetical protein BWQ96_01823 [Gracilariopsis chorda]